MQKRFGWNKKLNIILCKEILIHISTARAQKKVQGAGMPSLKSWEGVIAKSANFKPKSMQDHLKTVIENRKSQVASREEQSGTVVEDREIDVLIDSMICDKKKAVKIF